EFRRVLFRSVAAEITFGREVCQGGCQVQLVLRFRQCANVERELFCRLRAHVVRYVAQPPDLIAYRRFLFGPGGILRLERKRPRLQLSKSMFASEMLALHSRKTLGANTQ